MEKPQLQIIKDAKALSLSSGKPVLLTLLDSQECGDCKGFHKALDPVKEAFGDKLIVQEYQGSHKRRGENSKELEAALDHFKYDKTPGDTDGNQRGHFPCGALYVNGEEVYRLPADSVLSKMPAKEFARSIHQHAGITFSPKVLFGRGNASIA